jgi:hypothetical protein
MIDTGMLNFYEMCQIMCKEAVGLASPPNLSKDRVEAPINSKHLAVDDRLKAGWQAEDEIIATLRRFLGENCFKPAGHSSDSDKFDKVDGYLTYPSGRTYAVQIKNREGGAGARAGQDILVEVIKDFDNDIIGRDLTKKGKSELYICRTIDGKIIIAETAKIKEMAQSLVDEWKAAGEPFDDRGWYRGRVGSLFLGRGDPPARSKVVAFLPPAQFGGNVIEGIPCKLVPSLRKAV